MRFEMFWPNGPRGKHAELSIFRTRAVGQLLILALCAGISANAATFYIDYVSGSDSNTSAQAQSQSTPWQHMPGMSGASGNAATYSPQPGDVFILKGGTTWTFASRSDDLLTILGSGGYTIQGGQRLSPPWGSGYPILDGSNSANDRSGIYSVGRTNIVIDGLEITNTDNPVGGGGKGICVAGSASSWEIKNSYITMCGVDSVGFGPYGPPNNQSSFLFHNNVLENCGRFFWGIGDPTTFDDVEIYSNKFLGPGTVGHGTYHSDGIMLGASSTNNPSSLTHVSIHHNRFSGDWAQGATALIYLNNGATGPLTEYGGCHCLIYDNQLCIDSIGSLSPGVIVIYSGWQDVQIYNNTFSGIMSAAANAVCDIAVGYSHPGMGLMISNNIFSGAKVAIGATDLTSSTGLTVDYNLYQTAGNNHYIIDARGDYASLAALQAAGYEYHGIIADPEFLALPNGTSGSGNWALRPSSPAVGAGMNLGSMFTTDILGNSRPSTGAWDIGAYQYSASSSAVLPAPPTSLKVVSSGNGNLVVQNCETTSTPSGWVDNASPVWGYNAAPAPLDGSYSLLIDTLGGSSSTTFTPQASCWFFFMVNLTTPSPNNYIFQLADSSDTRLCGVKYGAGGIFSLIDYASAASTAPGFETDGTTYYIWGNYTAGTGANSTANLYISTTPTIPSSPTLSVTGAGSTGSASRVYAMGWSGGMYIFDDIMVCAGAIGSNPVKDGSVSGE